MSQQFNIDNSRGVVYGSNRNFLIKMNKQQQVSKGKMDIEWKSY